MTTLAKSDVERHLPGLRTLAEHKYPSIAMSEIGFSVDYTTQPITLDVFAIRELVTNSSRWFDHGLPQDRVRAGESLIDIVQASEGAKSVVCCIHLRGESKKWEMDAGDVGVHEDSFPDIEEQLPKPNRSPGQDPDGKIMATVADKIDQTMLRLGYLDASSWITSAHQSTKELYDKIDETLEGVMDGVQSLAAAFP